MEPSEEMFCIAACGNPVQTWVRLDAQGEAGYCIPCARAHNEHMAMVILRQAALDDKKAAACECCGSSEAHEAWFRRTF